MFKLQRSAIANATILLSLALGGCTTDSTPGTGAPGPATGVMPTDPATKMFTVTIENVSQPNTVQTGRAMGTVPLSHGVYAVFSGSDPLFTAGAKSDLGTERIAEDGNTDAKAETARSASGVKASGVFEHVPGELGQALGAGTMASFTVTASPGERLQLETMFVQSNDWFYAFDGGGLALFDGDLPVAGDVTSKLRLYDAGTEMDTAPGTGEFQKPAQEATALDVGPAESETIKLASERHPSFMIPKAASVIRITVTPRPQGRQGTKAAAATCGNGALTPSALLAPRVAR